MGWEQSSTTTDRFANDATVIVGWYALLAAGKVRVMITNQQRVNREIWLKALESGEYPQVKGALEKPGVGYCCLGVACVLAGATRESVEVKTCTCVSCTPETWVDYDGSQMYLPKSVMDWLGVSRMNPRVDLENGCSDSLGSLNDSGCSFSEIARIIRLQGEGWTGA